MLNVDTLPTHTQVKLEIVVSGAKLFEVAARAGIEPSRLSRILNGQKPARLDELTRIRQAIRG